MISGMNILLEKSAADDFYRKFFEKSIEILDGNGIMIIVSNEMGLIKKYIRLNKSLNLIRETILNEKDTVYVYVIKNNN